MFKSIIHNYFFLVISEPYEYIYNWLLSPLLKNLRGIKEIIIYTTSCFLFVWFSLLAAPNEYAKFNLATV